MMCSLWPEVGKHVKNMGMQDMVLPRAVLYTCERHAKNIIYVNNNFQKCLANLWNVMAFSPICDLESINLRAENLRKQLQAYFARLYRFMFENLAV